MAHEMTTNWTDGITETDFYQLQDELSDGPALPTLQKWAAKVGAVPTILTAARYLDCNTQDIFQPLPGPSELCVAEFVEAFPAAHEYQLKALAYGIDACHAR
jgi:hypothetical protein